MFSLSEPLKISGKSRESHIFPASSTKALRASFPFLSIFVELSYVSDAGRRTCGCGDLSAYARSGCVRAAGARNTSASPAMIAPMPASASGSGRLPSHTASISVVTTGTR